MEWSIIMRGRRKQNAVILHTEQRRTQMVIIMAVSISANLTLLLSKNKIQQLQYVGSCLYVNACIACNAISVGKNYMADNKREKLRFMQSHFW